VHDVPLSAGFPSTQLGIPPEVLVSTARKLVTVEDWLALPGEERAELIEGQLVYRTLPSAEHSFSASKLNGALDPFNRRGGGGGPGGWWIGTEAHVLYPGRPNGFVHDLAGWRRDRHLERPKGNRIAAKPDWICEIVSTNRRDDYVRKKRVLHEHRVEDYWLLDHRDALLTAMKWVEGGFFPYAEATLGEKVRLEPFEGVELDVSALLGETDD
jgi:Uma2 family endonuclease